MNVGVRARQRVAAMLARTARSRLGTGAEQPLSKPEGESLLADTGGSVEKERARERISTNRVVEAGTEGGVAVDGEEGHTGSYRRGSGGR
jgi:hypothetical protein